MKDTPEARALADIFALEFPDGRFSTASGTGIYRLEIDLHASVTSRQKALFLDLMRILEVQLVETVFIRGQLGDEQLNGYLGPDRKQKEKSRSRLNQIKELLRFLLPEHKAALRALLTDG